MRRFSRLPHPRTSKRRRADSNRCTGLCRPLPNLSATAPEGRMVSGPSRRIAFPPSACWPRAECADHLHGPERRTMTGKADFTEEEWELLREGPATAGMMVLLASGGGSFRETWALAKTFAEARGRQSESQLLDELVDEKPDAPRFGSAEEAEREGLERLARAVALLEQKATADDLESYKRFSLEVADRVAA